MRTLTLRWDYEKQELIDWLIDGVIIETDKLALSTAYNPTVN